MTISSSERAGEAGRTAHTPGPWSVGGLNTRMILRDIPGMCDGHDGYSIAVTTSHSLLPEAEALANARLIAAAPDLVKALEDIAALTPIKGHTISAAQEIARAALSAKDGR